VRLFLFFFTPFDIAAVIYLLLVAPNYKRNAKALIKFGSDSRPEVSSSPTIGEDASSVDEHHEMVQSNVRILTSRNLAEALLNDLSINRVYPKIIKNSAKR